MPTYYFDGLLRELWQPLVILGGGAIAESYFEKKEKAGAALISKLLALGLFVFLWLLPMFDRISWLFRGAMALPLG